MQQKFFSSECSEWFESTFGNTFSQVKPLLSIVWKEQIKNEMPSLLWNSNLLILQQFMHGKPFKLYWGIANFKKHVHQCWPSYYLGNSYLTDTSCREMLHFSSKSIINYLMFNRFNINQCLTNIFKIEPTNIWLTDTENQFYKILVIL